MTEPTRPFDPPGGKPKGGEPLSIQGERQQRAAIRWAGEKTVERWVTEHSPGVVACRERNRHDPPTIAETGGLHFEGIDYLGFHLRRTRCKSCKLVDIVEQWDVAHRGNVITKAVRVGSTPDYSVRGPNGEKYLGPKGEGRMRPKDVRSAIGTGYLKGMSYRDLRKETLANARQREA